MESIRLVLTQFTDETISISLAVLVVVFAVLVAYWFYNRRKFHQLSHQIPASVVKNYLDSIIANSTALKSSLFRGGGLEMGEGIPSIIPTSDLPTGGVAVGADHSEELASKNAEIANLKSMLNQKDGTIVELEKMLEAARASNGGGISDEEAGILRSEIETLKAQLEEANQKLANAPTGGGDNSDLTSQLDSVTRERDELKERLMEYEIIEEDLANLKKFQQENEQLKKTIAELKGEAPADDAPAVEEAPEPEPTPEPEPEMEAEAPEEEPVEEVPAPEPPPEVTAEENPAADDAATEAAADENPEVPANDGEQKSAAELLSEFEKMLG